MAEVGQNIALIQASHRHFGDDHFQECREGRENSLLSFFVTEPGSCGIVSALHDPATNKDFWMLGANMVESTAAFKIAVKNAD